MTHNPNGPGTFLDFYPEDFLARRQFPQREKILVEIVAGMPDEDQQDYLANAVRSAVARIKKELGVEILKARITYENDEDGMEEIRVNSRIREGSKPGETES